ncbi:MAG: hypothetical protein JWQ71_4948 [Pedosphaera sp.]|nr:hypothetical protein [Pedosphaera sp.]
MNPIFATSKIVLDPILPVPVVILLGVLMAALTLIAYVKVGSRLGNGKNLVLTVFRLIGIALVLLVLLQPSELEQIPPPIHQKVTLVALDTSRSMKQTDVEKTSRMDAAKNILMDADLIPRDGLIKDPSLRLFEFSENAVPVSSSLLDLTPKGESTRLHRSMTTIANSLAAGEGAKALILLTDGHDFELVNPSKTGLMAKSRQIPIYAVALGKQGKVRDASIRITSYQPYCYVKQKARISGMLRFIGCEFEDVQVELLRQNQVVQTQRINAGDAGQAPVQFEVAEKDVGQYEYEMRVVPLEGEVDKENNSAITYLNVIDQQIQVLVLEGSPYWDTTFLQRSLMRNDKIDLDSIIQYAPKKARLIRKKPSDQELKVPETAEQFNHYDVIILGRSVEKLLNREQLDLLQNYVKNQGGTVVFSRGPAFEGELAKNDLEPVIWDEKVKEKVRLQIGREGQGLAPFRILAEQSGADKVPELIAGRGITEKKPLTATLASAQGSEGGDLMPGIVQRRFGQGQVLSVGVDGLWRWAFNAKIEGVNTLFDRFWDQMVLWLMAGRDFLPNQQFSLRTSSANILLGEKAYFRVVMRSPDPKVKEIPIVFYRGEQEVGRTTLNPLPGQDVYRLLAEYLPEKVGKYRAAVRFPDGTTQESRFIVFQENLEETEVATDVGYLKRLCESSGGRLLAPGELAKLNTELRNEKVDTTPKTRLQTVWDRAWFFYLIGLLFGVDWYLRRRWGLC